MLIDAHQHFWMYDPVRDSWIDDTMRGLQRDFLPEDLESVYAQNGITGCVAVQADQSEPETVFLAELARKHAFIKGVVGWVDLRAPDVRTRLDHFSRRYPEIKGFRHIVQAETDEQFMLRPEFLNGIAALGEFGFTYDILIYPHQLKQALELATQFPEQAFVLDHLAKPYIKRRELEPWASALRALGACKNVSCKVSGLVTEADWTSWTPEDFDPYLEVALEAFGAGRLMFGSDWPVCTLAADFSQVLKLPHRFFDRCETGEKELIFYKNAARVYKI